MRCSCAPFISAAKLPTILRLFGAENTMSALSLPPRWSGAILATITVGAWFYVSGRCCAEGCQRRGGDDQDQPRHSVCGLVAHGFSSAGSLPAPHGGAWRRPGKRDAGRVRDQQLNRHRKSVVRLASGRQGRTGHPASAVANCFVGWFCGLQSMCETVSPGVK